MQGLDHNIKYQIYSEPNGSITILKQHFGDDYWTINEQISTDHYQ